MNRWAKLLAGLLAAVVVGLAATPAAAAIADRVGLAFGNDSGVEHSDGDTNAGAEAGPTGNVVVDTIAESVDAHFEMPFGLGVQDGDEGAHATGSPTADAHADEDCASVGAGLPVEGGVTDGTESLAASGGTELGLVTCESEDEPTEEPPEEPAEETPEEPEQGPPSSNDHEGP